MTDPTPEPQRTPLTQRERRLPSPIVVLTACLFVIAIGVQQWVYQDQRDDYDQCVSAWAADTTTALSTRSDATGDLETAKDARADAVDAIMGVVVGLREQPPATTVKQFDQVLHDWQETRADLDAVRETVDDTRTENPYPVFHC